MGNTPVQDELVITLDEIFEWLRLDPDLEATLIQPSSAGALTHKVSDLSGLRPGRWVSIAGVDAKITYVDVPESNVVVDRVVSVAPLSEQTTVTWSHHSGTIMASIETAKSLADQYLNNDFKKLRIINGVPTVYVDIPVEVKLWVFRYVAYLFSASEVGLVTDSVRESGSTRYDNRFETLMEPIRHLRKVVLG